MDTPQHDLPPSAPQAHAALPPFGGREPDRGSPSAAAFAWVAAAVLVAATVFLNQFPEVLSPPKPANAAEIAPPGMDPATLNAKVFVKLSKALPFTTANKQQVIGEVNKASKTPVDVFRSAIVAAELLGAEAATKRLELAASMNDKAAKPSPLLAKDIETVHTALASPEAEIPIEDREGLAARHGWFAELFLTRDLPDSDPVREAVVGGGGRIVVGLVFLGLVLLVAFAGGLTAAIVMGLRLHAGKVTRAFVPPLPGGSVYLEVLPVFVAAFVGMSLLGDLIAAGYDAKPPAWLTPARLATQFMLLLLTLYPLARGVSWAEHKALMGWHAGRGFWREVGAGIVGYFALLPLVAVGMALMMGIVAAKAVMPGLGWPGRLGVGLGAGLSVAVLAGVLARFGPRDGSRASLGGAAGFGALLGACAALAAFGLLDPDKSEPSNPIVDLVAGAPWWVLIAFGIMAVVWAPLAEESIFRGAFYRHLRSRVGMGLAAVVSAITFGVMHGYDFVLLVGVVTLGFNFALLREWRGSLVAPITAHALHNGTLIVLLFVLFKPLLA